MFCGYCGKQLNESDNFCKYCGKLRVGKENSIVQKENQISPEQELEIAYLEKDKNNFPVDKINFLPFLLGPYYLLYRKMYLYGSLWLFLTIFIGAFTNGWIAFLFYLVLAGYFAFQFNFLYQKKMEDDLKEIKRKYIDQRSRVNECKKMGGTNTASIVIVIVAAFVFIFFLSLYSIYRTDYHNYDNTYGEYYR